MKTLLTQIKPWLRWFIWGGVLFFLLGTVKDRYDEVAAIEIDFQGWLMLAMALSVTICAHIWSGWVWTWILKLFKQPLGVKAGIKVYLTTNIAKYSPGNIWHYYGRITAVSRTGGSKGAAILSVLLEPLLMAAAALLIGLISTGLGWLETDFNFTIILLQLLSLIAVGVGIHPRILNPLLHRLSRSKSKDNPDLAKAFKLESYPLTPFLGEVGFVLLRGGGFLFTFLAMQSIAVAQIPQLIGAFSFAWLLGLVVPGAPGGLGVFEVTAFSLLDNSSFPAEIAAVALYRLISILAETIAALAAQYTKRLV
ncbi:MAG: lysylphosphatidylglycerol synthase domain-containing protein [Cyanobacteria bacterium P01_G01_bin.19]